MKDRVLVAYPASELPFVPPFEQFLKLLGFNSGMSGMVKEIGLEAGKVPPSEKTLKTTTETLKEKQNELVLQAATLEGRIKLIRKTIHSLSGNYEGDN